jgi:hypothetical protein
MKKLLIVSLLVGAMVLSACNALADTNAAGANGCPEAGEGTEEYTSEAHGFYLLYPEQFVISELASGTFRIEEEPPAIPHPAPPFAHIEVTDAAGASAAEIADEVTADLSGFELQREDITLGGEAAILFERLPGQELGRGVLAEHNDKLFRLTFYTADEERPEYEAMLELYQTLTDSFTYINDA